MSGGGQGEGVGEKNSGALPRDVGGEWGLHFRSLLFFFNQEPKINKASYDKN